MLAVQLWRELLLGFLLKRRVFRTKIAGRRGQQEGFRAFRQMADLLDCLALGGLLRGFIVLGCAAGEAPEAGKVTAWPSLQKQHRVGLGAKHDTRAFGRDRRIRGNKFLADFLRNAQRRMTVRCGFHGIVLGD